MGEPHAPAASQATSQPSAPSIPLPIARPEIGRYLPHKGGMLLLDRIVGYDTENFALESEIDLPGESLFYNSRLGGVPAWVGFEYMAQSIAALSGVQARALRGAEPKIGFIMNVRAFKTDMPAYPAGKVARVRVKELFRDGSVVAFDCALEIDGATVTTATVNAIEIDSIDALNEVSGER